MNITNNKPPGKTPVHVLIAAAGQGSRFGSAIPKQYVKIAGKTILRHTLDNVLSWPDIASVSVIINPDHKSLYEESVGGLLLPPPTEGGKERKDSIYNGLKNISQANDKDIILIHDAARPFADRKTVSRLIEALQTDYLAGTLAYRLPDTLRMETQGLAGERTDRAGLWGLQTPQGFIYEYILKAHEKYGRENHTDDTSLISQLAIPVKFIESSRANFKITTGNDLHMAEALLNRQNTYRTGLGFDVHAFGDDDRPLRICGIDIEYERSLSGHSDADVGLHAITDALLGAIGEGDIGHHFPPGDPEYKNMDSSIFLKKTCAMIAAKQAIIENIDVTIICEAPKIGPYREKMKTTIARICDIESDRINVKATTTERLGFTGREEGIAAQAVTTISCPGRL